MYRGKKQINPETDDIIELFPDEAERKKLFELPQLERETLIGKVYEEKIKEKEMQKIINDTKKGTRDYAIQDIKNKRINFNNRKQRTYEEESPELGEVSSQEYQRRVNKKGKLNDDEDYEVNEEEKVKQSETTDIKIIKDEEDEKTLEEDSKITDIEDIEKIRISRKLFETYHSHKLFKETIKNCFVRVNLGGKHSVGSQSETYIVAVIKDIVESPGESYKISDKTYSKYFIAHNGESEKKFSFNFISNSPFEKFEFEKWITRMERNNIQLPKKAFIRKKEEDIEKMKNYEFTTEEILNDINEKRAEKIRNRDKGLNVLLELEDLSDKFKACSMKINDFQAEINRLENYQNNSNSKSFQKKKAEISQQINFYSNQKDEIVELLEILKEMHADNIKAQEETTRNERTFIINIKNAMNQKEIDKENRMLNKKRNLDEENPDANPYKRRECAPMNRFSKNTVNAERFNSKTIKMTETKEDLYAGTPKEMYNKRIADLKESRVLMQSFCEKINFSKVKPKSEESSNVLNLAEQDILKRISDCNNSLQTNKKGYYGLFKTAGINIFDYIKSENQRLLKKYNLMPNDVPEFQFI